MKSTVLSLSVSDLAGRTGGQARAAIIAGLDRRADWPSSPPGLPRGEARPMTSILAPGALVAQLDAVAEELGWRRSEVIRAAMGAARLPEMVGGP